MARKAKTPQQLRKQALELLQKLVRLKAADEHGLCTCVTCGCKRIWNDGIHGGHCGGCNNFGMRNGDAAQRYTVYMIDMYGRDFVDQMLADAKKPKKLYSADYREMIADYKEQIKYHLDRIGM